MTYEDAVPEVQMQSALASDWTPKATKNLSMLMTD